MGRTIKQLAKKDIGEKSIFHNRFVVEICERVHTHYRNLRIVQTLDDFISMAESFNNALDRWKKRGCPGTGARHIELCRRQMIVSDPSNTIEINLNENLYNKNEGHIFSEGADFKDEQYIHLKIRDLRLEMSIEEFKTLVEAGTEAYGKLSTKTSSSNLYVSFPETGIH